MLKLTFSSNTDLMYTSFKSSSELISEVSGKHIIQVESLVFLVLELVLMTGAFFKFINSSGKKVHAKPHLHRNTALNFLQALKSWLSLIEYQTNLFV